MNKVKLIIVCYFVSLIFALLNTAVAAEFNEEVYLAQVELDALGYDPGPAEGLWTEKTMAAIIKFQKDNNLQTNGQLNEATKNILKTKIVSKFIVAPKNIVDKILKVLNYEGSHVSIVYDPSGEAISILKVEGNWRIILSEIGDNIRTGNVSVIGKARAGDKLSDLPDGAKAGGGKLYYDVYGIPHAGEGGVMIYIETYLE